MRNPYFHAGNGLYFEATDAGGVEVIVKDPDRLSGRTVVRVALTIETLEAGVERMKELLVDVDPDHGALGPRVLEANPEPLHVFHAELEDDEAEDNNEDDTDDTHEDDY